MSHQLCKEKVREKKVRKKKVRKDITVSIENEFFIAIGYQADESHTFIMIGVRDKKTNQNHILSGAGKYLDFTLGKPHCPLLRSLLHPAPSRLVEENFIFEDTDTPITYKAFSISEHQYERYCEQIFDCTRSPYLGAYHRAFVDQAGTDKIKYEYNEFSPVELLSDNHLNQSAKNLDINNTCRHTANLLLKNTTAQTVEDNDISSFFLKKLPFSAHIGAGKLYGKIFILPIPPCKEQLGACLYLMLSRIYRRLEAVSKSYGKNENTYEKFEKLKELYLKLDTRNVERITQLFDIIENWERQNQRLIDAKRGFSLFRTTATRDMVTELMAIKCRP